MHPSNRDFSQCSQYKILPSAVSQKDGEVKTGFVLQNENSFTIDQSSSIPAGQVQSWFSTFEPRGWWPVQKGEQFSDPETLNAGPALPDKLTLTENRVKTIEEQVKKGK